MGLQTEHAAAAALTATAPCDRAGGPGAAPQDDDAFTADPAPTSDDDDASTASLTPTAARLAEVATAAAEAMSSINERVACAVCGCSVQTVDTEPRGVTEAPDAKWKLKLAAPAHLHAELRQQYVLGQRDEDADRDVHPAWCTMLLCPASLYDSADFGTPAIDVCRGCHTSLSGSSRSPPKDAIANGNWRGLASAVPALAAVEPHVSPPRFARSSPVALRRPCAAHLHPTPQADVDTGVNASLAARA
jgi:hypothetical protein